MLKKRDVVVLLCALALVACAFAARALLSGAGDVVRVYLDGALYGEYPLSQEQTVVVAQEDGRENVVTITGEGVYMARSTCENQLCVHQGTITKENAATRAMGAAIICLPNRVQVVLEGVTQDVVPDI